MPCNMAIYGRIWGFVKVELRRFSPDQPPSSKDSAYFLGPRVDDKRIEPASFILKAEDERTGPGYR